MRVLQVIGVMDRGGAETMVMNLYRAMDRERVQFDFLVHEQREGDYDAEIVSLGGRIFRAPRYNGVNGIAYRRCIRSLFANHPEWRVVHGHIGSCAPLYLSEAKRVGAFAIAHSHAQNYGNGLSGMAFNIAAHPVRRIADYFMACSKEAGLDRFGSSIVEGNRFAIVPNGIDVASYACDERVHVEAKADYGLAGRPVVCHTGRLIPVKNHEFLLEVFARVVQSFPNAVLLLAGRGDLEESIRARVDELGLKKAVFFLGVVDDVPYLLRAADVFVFPSVKEGLPLAVVEAQAAGLPTVISTGVPKFAVVSDRACRMSLSAGAEAWAGKCIEMLHLAQSTERSDACEQVREHGFDAASTSVRLASFYEAVAAGENAQW